MSRILPEGTRRRARLFSGFLSHYLIRDRYGRPGKGNDKGAMQGLMGWARHNFMVPLPRFGDFETMNRWLEARCRERQEAVPGAPFEVCEQVSGQVSSQSLVRYRTNDYSVPVRVSVSPSTVALESASAVSSASVRRAPYPPDSPRQSPGCGPYGRTGGGL